MLSGPATSAAAGPPLIAALWVNGVNTTEANLRAEINPNGFGTTYRFEYIRDVDYQANLNAVPPREGFFGALKAPAGQEAGVGSGSAPVSTFQHVAGLNLATVYHYRLVATNVAGTVIGPEKTFTTREIESSLFSLPDSRGWELVSPVDKGGGAIGAPGQLFGGGDFQAAAGGDALTYGSSRAFGEAAGAPPVNQYLSHRTASGWTTEDVSAPLASGAYGDQPDGAPYRLFSSGLERALLFGGLACRGGLEGCPVPNPVLPGSGAPPGYMAYYLRDSATGSFASLLGAADLAHSAVSPANFEVGFAATSPDLSHIVLASCAALTANAVEVPDGPGKCDPKETNLYERSASGLAAINLQPGHGETTPGAAIAAPLGAVSEDGARIYWTVGGNLYLRDGAQSVQVTGAEGGAFQAASADGGVAFFTKAGHIYRFTAATKASDDLTPSGGVVGVLGASANGSTVYYQDATGIERWREGATTPVVAGGEAAALSDFPPATGTARVSADGLHLAFLSKAEIDGHDNIDADTKQPDSEVYLYGPPIEGGLPQLICASCNPTGERPQGPSTIPGAQVNGTTTAYRARALSASGLRLIFDSSDRLLVRDTNSHPDVYQWEARGVGGCARAPGCVDLISSGRDPEDSVFIDASADGSDVYFTTNESLVPADPGSVDVYDARIGGGFPEAPKQTICIGDACQSLPSPPEDPDPGTLVPNSGNPPLHYAKEKKKRRKHRRKHRHGGKGQGKFHVTFKPGGHGGRGASR